MINNTNYLYISTLVIAHTLLFPETVIDHKNRKIRIHITYIHLKHQPNLMNQLFFPLIYKIVNLNWNQ